MKELSEKSLIAIALNAESDERANAAMKELRERFDPSYFWCPDCDGVVCKQKDCCIYGTSTFKFMCDYWGINQITD